MAIIGLHAILYSKKADETRAFFRDVLGMPWVDAGRGWLIFEAPPAEMAVHPAEDEESHELYLMCDDVYGTVAELKTKGVVTSPVTEQPWGKLTSITLPSGGKLGLYEPKHPLALGGGSKE